MSDHVFAHAGLADIDAEFEEFTVDARSTPERVFPAHLADQFADFDRKAWATRSAMTHLPGPEKSKALTMPADDGLGLDDDQGGPPVFPEFTQPRPKEPIGQGQLRLLDRPLHDTELMAESDDFEMQGRVALE